MYCSKFLKRITAEKNIQVKDIAILAGVSETFVSDLRNGKKQSKKETYREIIKHLRLTKEEETEAWKAWSMDRMDEKTIKYFEDLEKENQELKNLLNAIKFLKKEWLYIIKSPLKKGFYYSKIFIITRTWKLYLPQKGS